MRTRNTVVAMSDGGGSGSYTSSGALKADGTKFYQAYNELEKAKTIISAIRREFNSLYNNVQPGNLKNAINTLNRCKMEDLVSYVVKVRESLKQNDAQFKKDYNAEFEKNKDSLLQLNDGQYAFIATKETEYSILSELEEMATKGQLTDEGLKILEIQRLRVANIEIQEKISVTPITDPEYDKYVKEYFDNLKKQIDLDTKLTDTEKMQAKEKIDYEYNYSSTNTDYMRKIKKMMEELSSFEAGSTAYYEKYIEINNAQVEMYEYQLNAYYKAKPESEFTDADRQNIKQLKEAISQTKEINEKYKLYAQGYTDDMIEYENMSWWEKRWEDTKTIGCTIYTSVAGVGEAIIDGSIMLTAGTAGWVGNQFGATGLSTWVEDFVSTDYAKKQYDLFVDNGTLNSVSAYSAVHGVTDFIVTTGTYVCISFIPGVGGSAVMAAAGGGSAAETAFENGASFNEAFGATVINAALSFGTDFGLDKLNSSGVMNSMNVWGKVGIRTAIGVGEPAINMISEYALYGHENSDSLFDYGVDSGGFMNMLIGGTVANVSGLAQDYMKHKAEVDFQKKTEINTDLNNMTPEQRSQAWEDYYNQKYGNKSDVEHMSGKNVDGSNGSFVDQTAANSNSINYVNAETRTIVIAGTEVTTNLSDEQLIRFANDFFNPKPPITSLDEYPAFGVIENSAYLKVEADGTIGVNWVADNGSVPGTRKSTTIPANTQIDRYGNPNGIFAGKMELDANGNYVGVDYDARSLPYAEGSQQYTKMTVLKDINSDTVSDAINKLDKDSDLYKGIIAQLDYDKIPYKIDADTGNITVDCFESQIAAAYGHNGGGTQYELPLRANIMKQLGFLDY